MKRIVKIVLPILILTAAIGVFAALKVTKPEQPPAKVSERIWRVEVEEAQPRTLVPTLTLYGQVETASLFKAAAPAPSRVDRILVRDGARVKQGQLLVVLDERDFMPRLEQTRAEVADLEAQVGSETIRHESDLTALKQEQKWLTLARDGVDRANRMLKQRLGSDSEQDAAEQALAQQELTVSTRQRAIDDHPTRLQALEARLARARARLTETQLDYERSRIEAPYDGIVAGVQVAEGDQVKDNAVLLSLYSPDNLELRARIPARFQNELQQALVDQYAVSGEARFGDARIRLTLARVAGETDASGMEALFRIDEGSKWLRVGQVLSFGVGRIPRDNAVPVPYQAVYGGGRMYRLEEGRMRGLQVETLGNFITDSGEERLLVLAPGLKSGDRLVVTHLPNAIDGLRVEAVEPE